MSPHIPNNDRSDSFSYIGREGQGSTYVALIILMLGIFIGAVFGPSASNQAGLNTALTAKMAVATEAAAAQENQISAQAPLPLRWLPPFSP